MPAQKYVMTDTDRHGNLRHYFRRGGGRKVRMRSEPGTNEFKEEYERLRSASPHELGELRYARQRVRKEERLRAEGVIYFVRVEERIKIGFTTDLLARMDQLQTGCPYRIKLALAIPGDQDMELKLHREFAEDRLIGEWFALSKRMRNWLLAYVEGEVAPGRCPTFKTEKSGTPFPPRET